ncbi:MAG TPA: flagellar basal body rod protein FlgG [Firmicutes bacterium]|nr:flagellar basal body rod protein FlgG [Bacillota bacterium]
MLRSMYSGVSGLKTQQIKMDTIANNIANVNTVGFKQGDVYFKEMLSQDLGSSSAGAPFNREVGLGVSVGAIDTKFIQGALQSTGRELDFAIQGDGFFTVQTESGDTMYTRDGIFTWDSEGVLRTTDGHKVLGKDGQPINKQVQEVDEEGNPLTDKTGNPVMRDLTTNELMESFQINTFNNPAGLQKAGNNYYVESSISGQPQAYEGSSIVSGAVEMSNVDLSTEFTNMIITSRAFQANSRTITTSDEMLQELVNLKR